MSHPTHPVKPNGHADYERKDISVSAVVYFLVGLVVFIIVSYFIVVGVHHFLEKHFEAEQTPVSPLVTNAQPDTRHIPPQYNGDYEKYLKENFPAPQLETNERTELNEIRLREETILHTYDYVDRNAGTVRIPIDRAMDLVVERALLPVRQQSGEAAMQTAKSQPNKGNKK